MLYYFNSIGSIQFSGLVATVSLVMNNLDLFQKPNERCAK